MNKKTWTWIIIILLVAYFIPLDRCRCTLLEWLQGKRSKFQLGGSWNCNCRMSYPNRAGEPCAGWNPPAVWSEVEQKCIWRTNF